MNNPISFDWTLVVQIVSFLLLVYILRRYAWNPLMNMMEERRNFIESNIAQAEKERQQAEQIKREYQEEMRKARQEAQEVIAKATKLSEERSVEILAEAHEEAEKIRKSALADIERERDLAIAQVKAQVADLSVAVAEKIIRRNLDVKGQEDLIEQFIQEVGELPC
ncbi:F0F1 ATP synthase subunit B [Desulfitobacterium sp.]|uniref:F0F1 ATP synthase subunit B n=1 Tax=Desulfitobacterium sp. TaxID=49981 RepID=UPI002C806800|nr:F0F1 ATP synthase subunit B [Desulfitobacterium sp.]HVJ49218.1 F0F1 ATP synthase subunit B [Desulfitobacterium sp.]